jgi:RNA polymerase sigma factor (sigma-70 family)
MGDDSDVATWVRGAAAGDERAWECLVARFSGLVWSIPRAYGLRIHDAEEVAQNVWLLLAQHIDHIRQPEAIGGWLATTARRECLAVLRRVDRTDPLGEDWQDDMTDPTPGPDSVALAEERTTVLADALAQLDHKFQRVLLVLFYGPEVSYKEASLALGMPIGSIGPIRARALQQLASKLPASWRRQDEPG